MKKIILLFSIAMVCMASISAQTLQTKFTLDDFYSDNPALQHKVNAYFNSLSPSEKVAQLIMPAAGKYGNSEQQINSWIKSGKIGGVLLLNGTKAQFSVWVKKYDQWNKEAGRIPFLYSADAEPSLINNKIENTTPVQHANKIQSIEGVKKVAQTIADDLKDIGIIYDFAPVVDQSKNNVVGWRSFGRVPEHIVPWSNAFIDVLQKNNIIATAKHFPGHGLVKGDSHLNLVYIDGEMKEVETYIPLIKNGIISIMVSHIAVKNNPKFNTHGLPASVSHKIVTDLLRDSLNFKGLIITDAMNMKGVTGIANENIKAIKAGVDIVLMPINAGKVHDAFLKEYNSNPAFKNKVDTACKRVIKAKLCTVGELFPQLKE